MEKNKKFVNKVNNDRNHLKRKLEHVKKQKKALFFFTFYFFVCLESFFFPPNIVASQYTDAYAFYQQNENSMKFVPSTTTDGNIYYATKGKKGYNVSTLYSTIGWKVSVKHNNGTILQTLYFKLGGNYMKTIHTKEVNGYEYSLYAVRLGSIKDRMNQNSKSALEKGECTLLFDACIAVKKRGVLQGAMNDNGVTNGTVHMTYKSIVNAAPWSSATKTALASYYNRSVQGLFSTLTLHKDEGILSVKGAGTYCYGTKITIDAIPLDGYTFAGWSGSQNYSHAKSVITIGNKDISLKATSKLSSLLVTYFRNIDVADTKTEQQMFLYGGNVHHLKDFGWRKEGYHQVGWALKRQAKTADYSMTNTISDKWILQHLPKVNLYAVWNVNQYKIIFDANGGMGTMLAIDKNYTDEMKFPQNSFTYENGTFLGWSLSPVKIPVDYTEQQTIPIKELAEKTGVVYSNHAEIKLYAIWDNAPAIAAEDIYVSLQDAKAGKITEMLLASYAKVSDKEDGEITYGNHAQNLFLIENYEGSKFLELEKEDQIKLTFYAKDSSGNICRREITVFIVDTDFHKEAEIKGRVRFLSGTYYKDENGNFVAEENGGLMQNSIWKMGVYQTILDELFLME